MSQVTVSSPDPALSAMAALPMWARVIGFIGFPVAGCSYLIWFLVATVSAQQAATLDAVKDTQAKVSTHLSDMSKMERSLEQQANLLRLICAGVNPGRSSVCFGLQPVEGTGGEVGR